MSYTRNLAIWNGSQRVLEIDLEGNKGETGLCRNISFPSRTITAQDLKMYMKEHKDNSRGKLSESL